MAAKASWALEMLSSFLSSTEWSPREYFRVVGGAVRPAMEISAMDLGVGSEELYVYTDTFTEEDPALMESITLGILSSFFRSCTRCPVKS